MVLVGGLSGGAAIERRHRDFQQAVVTAPPKYYRDVLPILQERCEVCHRDGGIASVRFQGYARTRPYALAIKAVTQEKSMPPWFADEKIGKFSNDPSLTTAQIATLAAWAEAGAGAAACGSRSRLRR